VNLATKSFSSKNLENLQSAHYKKYYNGKELTPNGTRLPTRTNREKE
jgi:hypothetical protein